MTRFLKQTCTFASAQRKADGSVLLDKFGVAQYNAATTIKCRREQKVQYVETSTGAMVIGTITYYVDNTNSPRVGDKLDGVPILAVEDFVNGKGGNEGYRCIA